MQVNIFKEEDMPCRSHMIVSSLHDVVAPGSAGRKEIWDRLKNVSGISGRAVQVSYAIFHTIAK